MGFGKIYKKNLNYNRELGFKAKDQYYYVATSIKDLLGLKEIFSDAEFFTKKKKDVEIFFKILDLKRAKKHLKKEGYEEILTLTNQINSKMRENFKIGSERKLYAKGS